MTINQAIDKLTSGKKLTPDQEKLKVSLIRDKMEKGGRTPIEDKKRIKEILAQETEDLRDQDPA